MSETIPTPEEPKFTREQVVDAFRKFPRRGYTSPDDLPHDDVNVISAYALFQVWDNQQKTYVEKIGTEEARLAHNLDKSTIFVDAGFSDRDYLEEVAHDWLMQDLQSAEDAGLTVIAERIKAKINEIELILAK